MQLSIEEVKKLDSNSYQIIDIRSEEEVAHGAIKEHSIFRQKNRIR